MSLLLMAAANSGGEIPIFARNVGPFFLIVAAWGLAMMIFRRN